MVLYWEIDWNMSFSKLPNWNWFENYEENPGKIVTTIEIIIGKCQDQK